VDSRAYKAALNVLAENVKRRRIELGLTQEEAAETTRMNPRHYQKLEAGAVNITLRTLARVAGAFETDIASLVKSGRGKRGKPVA